MGRDGHSYKLLVVEDQKVTSREEIEAALAADRALDQEGDPYLELDYLARTKDDALQYLELQESLPDAIVIDDYLPEGTTTQSACLDIMAFVLERCRRDEIRLQDRPRAVLWTAADPALVYTFCVLGGMQFRDKRSTDGLLLPVDEVWTALAGRRWQPDPYPTGLIESRRVALPWLEAGWQVEEVVNKAPEVPGLASHRVTQETLNLARESIQSMANTPDKFSPDHPLRWGGRMFSALRANGWVWVPLHFHARIPAGAPLPLVIDPDVHREPLPPYGPLPARVPS